MTNLYTGSTILSNMSTGLSTQIIIQVAGQSVGAIQSFSPKQNRPVKGVAEIGTDGFIEKTPHQPTDITIDVQRIVFDRLSLPAAFARQFVNIAAQRVPFDILVFDRSNVKIPDLASDKGEVPDPDTGLIVHTYKNCWFQSLSTTYSAGDYIISEQATIQCEFVQTVMHSGGQSVSSIDGGLRGMTADRAGGNIEALADTGRRGSLDAAGLARILFVEPTTAG